MAALTKWDRQGLVHYELSGKFKSRMKSTSFICETEQCYVISDNYTNKPLPLFKNGTPLFKLLSRGQPSLR